MGSRTDGSTDVGTDKNEVEDDAFVDKDEDNNDWVAGPDGSNYKLLRHLQRGS